MTNKDKERKYRQLTDCRLHLLFGGILSDGENNKLKAKIDKWAVTNGLKTYPERAIQEALKK